MWYYWLIKLKYVFFCLNVIKMEINVEQWRALCQISMFGLKPTLRKISQSNKHTSFVFISSSFFVALLDTFSSYSTHTILKEIDHWWMSLVKWKKAAYRRKDWVSYWVFVRKWYRCMTCLWKDVYLSHRLHFEMFWIY